MEWKYEFYQSMQTFWVWNAKISSYRIFFLVERRFWYSAVPNGKVFFLWTHFTHRRRFPLTFRMWWSEMLNGGPTGSKMRNKRGKPRIVFPSIQRQQWPLWQTCAKLLFSLLSIVAVAIVIIPSFLFSCSLLSFKFAPCLVIILLVCRFLSFVCFFF